MSEWELTGLTPVPSDVVKPPRVGESAFSMECVLDHAHDVGIYLHSISVPLALGITIMKKRLYGYIYTCIVYMWIQVYSDEEKRIQTGTMIIGRIKRFHVRKDILTSSGAIDTGKLLPVSRLGGIGYGRTTEAFGGSRGFSRI